MHTLYAFLFLAAVLSFVVAAVESRSAGAANLDRRANVNLVALGLAFFATPFMIDAFRVAF